MSQEQREDLETRVRDFGRFLTEGTESELQEFIDEAPPELPNQPIELLERFKALVDQRIAAEPERKITYMYDPHQIRVRQWNKISDRIGAEINFRTARSSLNSPKATGTSSLRSGAEEQHAVAARRVVVRQSANMSDKEICEALDREGIGLPRRWQGAGFDTWERAWQKRRSNIQVIFSKDRKRG